MAIDQLQDVIKAYLLGKIDYAAFRERFVREHLSNCAQLCLRLEGACADFEDGLASKAEFRQILSDIATPMFWQQHTCRIKPESRLEY